MVHILNLPSEVLQQIYAYVFDERSILFESPRRKDELYFPQTRPEQWQLALLQTCHTMRTFGEISLKNALSDTTVIYRNCTPAAPDIRGHARVIDFTSDTTDLQRSKNFVRYRSYSVRKLVILGLPQSEFSLDAFGKLQVLTLGSVPLLVTQGFERLEVPKFIDEKNFNHPSLRKLIIKDWESYGALAGGPHGWQSKISPEIRKILVSKKASASETRGTHVWRDKRTFDLHCQVVVDFSGVYRDDERNYILCTGIIDVDKEEVIELKYGGYFRYD